MPEDEVVEARHLSWMHVSTSATHRSDSSRREKSMIDETERMLMQTDNFVIYRRCSSQLLYGMHLSSIVCNR